MAAVLAGEHSRKVWVSQNSSDMVEKNCVENDITAFIDRATDFLLMKDFEKCASECTQGLIIAKQQVDQERCD